jgi:hypothetical protein
MGSSSLWHGANSYCVQSRQLPHVEGNSEYIEETDGWPAWELGEELTGPYHKK